MNLPSPRILCGLLSLMLAHMASAQYPNTRDAIPIPKRKDLPVAKGPFDSSVESLKQYQCPEWFRNAKFGIWSHWGPQAVPGMGDWYARKMYGQYRFNKEKNADELNPIYKAHVKNYGHPSKFGYKDILPLWKAEKWEPDRLMALYKKAGARYFFAQAVHHDNFDNWDSKYHRWNSVAMGPHKDIVGIWRDAALKQGLRFGVSEHLGASFTWFQGSHGADKQGPLAGVPYDGADPKFQDLYHPAADASDTAWYSTNPAWHEEWFARIKDVVDRYHPDLLYSDGGLPFGEVGRSLVAHFYNANREVHDGKLEAVYNCKKTISGEFTEGTCVQDVERGGMNGINPAPWQTDTSVGDWFYNKKDHYKSTGLIIHLLADIVSKNGNMLLNVVQYPDGSLPPEMEKFLNEMADWMAINGEAIYETRPWKTYGEGPTVTAWGHFKEDFPFNSEDIRFTTKNGAVYAIALGVPEKPVRINALGLDAGNLEKPITEVTLLGSAEKLQWKQEAGALVIQPVAQWPCKEAVVFEVK